MPTTPTGSRVISTSTPGRTEAIFSPARRRHSPAKNRKICPARAASPMPSGKRLAFLAREQAAELLLAGEDLVADLASGCRGAPAASSATRPGTPPSPPRWRARRRRASARGELADHVVGVRRVDVGRRVGGRDPFAGDEVLCVNGHDLPGSASEEAARGQVAHQCAESRRSRARIRSCERMRLTRRAELGRRDGDDVAGLVGEALARARRGPRSGANIVPRNSTAPSGY